MQQVPVRLRLLASADLALSPNAAVLTAAMSIAAGCIVKMPRTCRRVCCSVGKLAVERAAAGIAKGLALGLWEFASVGSFDPYC